MPDFDTHYPVEHPVLPEQSIYSLVRSIDNSVRELHNEMYLFRRDFSARVANIEKTQEKHSTNMTTLKQDNAILKNDTAELKEAVKELRREVSDIKGDIKALAAGFGVAQNRFNWTLVILGIVIALIQMLK